MTAQTEGMDMGKPTARTVKKDGRMLTVFIPEHWHEELVEIAHAEYRETRKRCALSEIVRDGIAMAIKARTGKAPELIF